MQTNQSGGSTTGGTVSGATMTGAPSGTGATQAVGGLPSNLAGQAGGAAGTQVGGQAGTVGTPLVPAGGQPATGGPQAAPGGSFAILLLPILLLGFLIAIQIFAGRKERKKRAALMASMGKGDRVQTSAGIIGTIAEMYDDEVVIRVDEASNTRVRFAKAAVVTVLRSGPAVGSGGAVESKPAGSKVGV